MGFDEGQIVLNSDNGRYYPGQMLYGRLEFTQDKDKKFRGIYAEIKGRCKVHWETQHSRRVNDRTEHYSVAHDSYEEYMNITIYLIGSKSGEQTLHPGKHVFPFECQIPPHCPSSFEGSEGSIRYTVKVTVDRAFKMDQTKLAVFRVDSPLDLNTIPQCKDPIAMSFEQTFCCWCMSSGLAETLVKLPAAGWCPKQVIPIEIACNNNSNVEIDTIKFTLRKIINFEAEQEPDSRSYDETIAVLKKGPIPGNTTRNWTMDMEIPDMEVPNLKTCRFIDVKYRFKVEIETSGCHVDEDDEHPIYIGTVPLGSLQYPPNSNFENVQNAQGVTSYPAPPINNQPASNYPNTAPYPGANTYPGNNPNIGFTAENPPYPSVTLYPAPSPYPVPSNFDNPPYPAGNTGANPPFVTAQHVNSAPYPASNTAPSPYPAANAYPGVPGAENQPFPNPNSSPYPPSSNMDVNPPYSTSPNAVSSPPYPISPKANPSYQTSLNVSTTPYPPANQTPGNHGVTGITGLKTGSLGFTGSNGSRETIPLLPPSAMPRPSSPFASASAPPPSTPDDENKKLGENISPYPL